MSDVEFHLIAYDEASSVVESVGNTMSTTFQDIQGQTQSLVSTTDEATSQLTSDYNNVGEAASNLQSQQAGSQASFGASALAMNNVALAGTNLFMSFERVENAQVMVDRANLTVQRSTEALEKAQTAYNDAVAKYGPNSAEATAALDKLNIAQQALQVSQERADMAGRNYNNTILMSAVMLIPSLISIISTVSNAEEIWTGIQWGLNAAMDANPIGIIILAIAGLIAVIIAAYTYCEPFRDAVNALGSALSGAFLAAVNAVRDALAWVWNTILAGVSFFKQLWETITNNPILAFLFGPITTIAFLIQHWGDIVNTIKDGLSFLWNNILVPLGSFIQNTFGAAISFITGLFEKLYDIIKPIVDAINGVKDVMGGFVNTISGALGSAGNAISGFIGSICFAHALQNAADASKTTMDNWSTMVQEHMNTGLDAIKQFNAGAEISGGAVAAVAAAGGAAGGPVPVTAAARAPTIYISGPVVQIQGSADKATAKIAADLVQQNLKNVIIEPTSFGSPIRKRVRVGYNQ